MKMRKHIYTQNKWNLWFLPVVLMIITILTSIVLMIPNFANALLQEQSQLSDNQQIAEEYIESNNSIDDKQTETLNTKQSDSETASKTQNESNDNFQDSLNNENLNLEASGKDISINAKLIDETGNEIASNNYQYVEVRRELYLSYLPMFPIETDSSNHVNYVDSLAKQGDFSISTYQYIPAIPLTYEDKLTYFYFYDEDYYYIMNLYPRIGAGAGVEFSYWECNGNKIEDDIEHSFTENTYIFTAVFIKQTSTMHTVTMDINSKGNVDLRDSVPTGWTFVDGKYYKDFESGTSFTDIYNEWNSCVPHKPGYKFKSYDNKGAGAKLTEDTTVVPVWDKQLNCKVTMSANGGTHTGYVGDSLGVKWEFDYKYKQATSAEIPYDTPVASDVISVFGEHIPGLMCDWDYNYPTYANHEFTKWGTGQANDDSFITEAKVFFANWTGVKTVQINVETNDSSYGKICGGSRFDVPIGSLCIADDELGNNFTITEQFLVEPILRQRYVWPEANEGFYFDSWLIAGKDEKSFIIDEDDIEQGQINITANFKSTSENATAIFSIPEGAKFTNTPEGWNKVSDYSYTRDFKVNTTKCSDVVNMWNGCIPNKEDYVFAGWKPDVERADESLLKNDTTWTAQFVEDTKFIISVYSNSNPCDFDYKLSTTESGGEKIEYDSGTNMQYIDNISVNCSGSGSSEDNIYYASDTALYYTYKFMPNTSSEENKDYLTVEAVYEPNLPEGRYKVNWKLNGESINGLGNVEEKPLTFSYEIEEITTAGVMGGVFDYETLSDLQDVDLEFRPDDASPSEYIHSKTDEDGIFYFETKRATGGVLYASKDGYATKHFNLTAKDLENNYIFPPEEEGFIPGIMLQKMIEYTGKVVIANDVAQQGATVWFVSDQGEISNRAVTDANGLYKVTMPYAFRGVMNASCVGYDDVSVTITKDQAPIIKNDITKDGDSRLKLSLTETGVLCSFTARQFGDQTAHEKFRVITMFDNEIIADTEYTEKVEYRFFENSTYGIAKLPNDEKNYSIHVNNYIETPEGYKGNLDYYICPVAKEGYEYFAWYLNKLLLADYKDPAGKIEKENNYEFEISYIQTTKLSLSSINNEGIDHFEITQFVNDNHKGVYSINELSDYPLYESTEISIAPNGELYMCFQDYLDDINTDGSIYKSEAYFKPVMKENYVFTNWLVNNEIFTEASELVIATYNEPINVQVDCFKVANEKEDTNSYTAQTMDNNTLIIVSLIIALLLSAGLFVCYRKNNLQRYIK